LARDRSRQLSRSATFRTQADDGKILHAERQVPFRKAQASLLDIIVKLEAKKRRQGASRSEGKDLERHLKNEQSDTKQEEKETAPVEVDEKDDIQLQRAIDILKTWDVFKEIPKAA